MKSVLAAVAISSALVLAGCGPSGPGVDPDEYGAVVEEAPNRLLTEAQIKKALLTVKDLPDGWSFSSEYGDGGGANLRTTSSDPGCAKLTAALSSDDEEDTSAGEADVTFSKGQYGPFLTQTVRSKGGDDAVGSIKSLRSALKGCDYYTVTDPDQGVATNYTVSDLPFPALGDDTVAMTLRASSQGQSFDIPMAIVRVDQSLVMLASFLIGKGMSAKDFEAVARKAVKKVKAVS